MKGIMLVKTHDSCRRKIFFPTKIVISQFILFWKYLNIMKYRTLIYEVKTKKLLIILTDVSKTTDF